MPRCEPDILIRYKLSTFHLSMKQFKWDLFLLLSFFPSSQSQLLIQLYSLPVSEVIASQVWSCC